MSFVRTRSGLSNKGRYLSKAGILLVGGVVSLRGVWIASLSNLTNIESRLTRLFETPKWTVPG